FPPPPMAKILELIHEWKSTLCAHSKHKEDLVHIRDMHRLLSYKGYRFPDFDRRAASVLNPADNLQTPDELEEEDRAAQAAKLQELIRRGSPKDLAAAQELMKVMSGAVRSSAFKPPTEPEKKPDYEQQVSKELDRIQQRTLLLNEMLNNAKPKERFAEGDSYHVSLLALKFTQGTHLYLFFQQIANKCRQVQPKIQKWIEESAENDPGSMDRLLLMNDLINNVVRRYEAFKAGDRSATADIDATFTTKESTAKAKTAAQQVSLIDFDFDEVAPVAPTPTSSSDPMMDDFSALASLSLGPSASTSSSPAPGQKPAQVDPLSLFDLSPAGFSAQIPPGSMQAHSFAQPSQPQRPPGPISTGSGSFFSNPAYGNGAPRGNGKAPQAQYQQPQQMASPINWGTSSSSSPIGRASTPITPGAIQLGGPQQSQGVPSPYGAQLSGSGNGNGIGGAMNGGSWQSQRAAPAVPPKADPFGDLLGDF
ncbi:hypothetical protein P7C70_g2263, partial [Phenoliferia sp. Uapishka_3]